MFQRQAVVAAASRQAAIPAVHAPAWCPMTDTRTAAGDDGLRAEIQRRAEAALLDAPHDNIAGAIIDICEALVREERERWGHCKDCKCGVPDADKIPCDSNCRSTHYLYVDPRCAPLAPAPTTCPTCGSDRPDKKIPLSLMGGEMFCMDIFHSRARKPDGGGA